MRRWNGWGDEKTDYPLPASALKYLQEQLGPGEIIPDIPLSQVIASVPQSDIPPHPSILTDPLDRLYHARGQSLPDWVALRHGQIERFPDGVIYPESEQQVRELIGFARKNSISLIPYGGGTSVVGHINPASRAGVAEATLPILTVDLSKLNKLEDIDEISLLATFGAGVSGPEIEQQLNQRGYTLGHFPQSFELSTLGGWIATRSSGQQSYYYGRIEDLFAGGHVETSLGPLEFPPLPASAAGPDLRQIFLGSEGRYGIITQAQVRIRRLPESEAFYGVFFRNWEAGVETVRQIAQQRIPVSMARLSNPLETETTLRLSGKDDLVGWAKRGLGWLNYGDQRSLLVLGVTGDPDAANYAHRRALEIARSHSGLYTGATIGKLWRKSRFLSPYLRNTLWEQGYAIDTLETALTWAEIQPTAAAVLEAIRSAIEKMDQRVLVFAHLSHFYRDGASLYVTYLFRRSRDPQETLQRWQAMKSAASQAILAHHGTISHQHGVGVDHAPYLAAEKSPLGIDLLRQTAKFLDPEQLFNPGKLIPSDQDLAAYDELAGETSARHGG